MATILFVVLLIWIAGSFYYGRRRASAVAGVGGPAALHSRPGYYGSYAAIWAGVPALVVFATWILFETAVIEQLVVGGSPYLSALSESQLGLKLNQVRNAVAEFGGLIDPKLKPAIAHYKSLETTSFAVKAGFMLIAGTIGLFFALRQINPSLRARNRVEKFLMVLLVICSVIAILTTLGIVLSLLFEAVRFFTKVPVWEFFFGTQWSTQTAIREGQQGASGAFGAIPVFLGTAMISFIAMLIAVPVGLFSAIYLSEYASPRTRGIVKPAMEVLAGIPTVVYGVFAALTVAPFFKDIGGALGLEVSAQSALAAGVVMGIMIIPFVSSISDDVINAVPQSLRDGAYALGATPSETIRQILLPAALPGIVGGVLLAVSRAVGETMIVVMAAGAAANLTVNPLEPVTTVTVQIVKLLTGDQAFDSAKTLSAFALGLTLFMITLLLNVAALRIVQKYREKYD